MLRHSDDRVYYNEAIKRSFVIEAGHHYYNGAFCPIDLIKRVRLSKSIHVMANFNESMLYELKQNKGQVNKLFGLSQFPFPHYNSIRYGWTGEDGKITLYRYQYVKGKRSIEKIGQYTPNASGVYLPIATDWSVNFLLLPYFGGKEPAPHKVTINLSIF